MQICQGENDKSGNEESEKEADSEEKFSTRPSQKKLQREAELQQSVKDLMKQAKVAGFKEVE